MKQQPDVSVVMGVYNGASELVASIESILAQRDVDLELIVVDDGSTDESPALLQAISQQDQRLRVYRQDNQGLTTALIVGCRLAKGQYIARQDVGDISHPSRLARQASMLDASATRVLVFCAYDLLGPNDEILAENCLSGAADDISKNLQALNAATLAGPHHGTVMFRKEAYERVGGYRSAFYFAQDLDLWVRLITVGDIVGLPETLCQLRFGYASLSARHAAKQRQLRHLIAQAEQHRRRGIPQDDILAEAASIRPSTGPAPKPGVERARTAYFLGSNLRQRGDHPAANRYFYEAVRSHPLHIKAWLKLTLGTIRRWV